MKNQKLFLKNSEEESSDLSKSSKRKLQEVKNLTKKRLKDNAINSLAKVLQFNSFQEKEMLSTKECINLFFKRTSEFLLFGLENKCILLGPKPACARLNNKTLPLMLVVDTTYLKSSFLTIIESLREL